MADHDAEARRAEFHHALHEYLDGLGTPEKWEIERAPKQPGLLDQVTRGLLGAFFGASRPTPGDDHNLGQDAISYVLTGSPDSVLVRSRDALGASAIRDIGARWGSRWSDSDERAGRLCQGLGVVDPASWVRWGRLANAVTNYRDTARLPGWYQQFIATVNAAAFADMPAPASIDDLRAVAEAGGLRDVDLALLPFQERLGSYERDPWIGLRELSGTSRAFAERHADIALFVHDRDGDVRLRSIEILSTAETPSALFAPDLAYEACGGHSGVRKAAIGLLDFRFEAQIVRDELELIRDGGTAAQRLHAYSYLIERRPPSEREALIELAAADRSGKIKSLAEAWRKETAVPPGDELEMLALQAGPAAKIDWAIPAQEARSFSAQIVESAAEEIAARNARQTLRRLEREQAGRDASGIELISPLPEDFERQLATALTSAQISPLALEETHEKVFVGLAGKTAEQAGVSWRCLLKALHALGVLRQRWSLDGIQEPLIRLKRTGTTPLTPRLLADALTELGEPGFRLVWESIGAPFRGRPFAAGWDSEEVWPFIATNLRTLLSSELEDEQIEDATNTYFFDAVATLPWLPRSLSSQLFEAATGERKRLRERARLALANHPDRVTHATAALKARSAKQRASAAEWLAEIGDASAAQALADAATAERDQQTRNHMRDALAILSPNSHMPSSKDRLMRDASEGAGLVSRHPLPWTDLDAHPPVHWADSKQAVPEEVIEWLLISAVRAKEPRPGPTLIDYCHAFDQEDRAELALWILRRWMIDDLESDAAELVADIVKQVNRVTPSNRENFSRWQFGLRASQVDSLTVKDVKHLLGRGPTGSAIALKGVLAVVAACGDNRVVSPAQQYITTHYGMRLAQSKALTTMLAWVDDPAAIQQVLSLAERFRTKSIQQEAAKQIEAVAQFRGWSADELGDRTVPTAGFGPAGEQTLDLGSRTFTAHLVPGPALELRSDKGKVVKSLPKPTNERDERSTSEAKRALATARKELKQVIKVQTSRLYDAMCTQRVWETTEWRRLVAHPIVRFLAARLVWVSTAPTGAVLFRPTAEGRVVGADGEPVSIPEDGEISLAHRVLVSDSVASAWQDHRFDSPETALFDQFSATLPPTGGREQTDTELRDFEGFAIEVQALRGVLTRRGYFAGEVGDGPTVDEFLKYFAGPGITSVIRFTGARYPFEDQTVAIMLLGFRRDTGGWTLQRLSEIPPVLLAESFNDLRIAVAKGSGFEPAWEAKYDR